MPSWPAALNLRERLAVLRGSHSPPLHVDRETAERRFNRWKSEKVFTENSSLLAERLADGVTEEELQSVLGIPAPELANHSNRLPDWASGLDEAYNNREAWDEIAPVITEVQASLGKSTGFLRAAAGFIAQARKHLHDGLVQITTASNHSLFDLHNIERLLLQSALAQVLGLLNRTLVLELNVARVQDQLAGDTPEERFESFIARLGEPEVVSTLWEEYPVLARQVIVALTQWVETSLEFFHRLVADWKEIRSHFFPSADPGLIIRLNSSGDRHHGGRSVHIAEFSNGSRLVYKPRSLELDQHFQELLAWINERNPELQFRLLKLLPKDGYGWIDYVDSAPCDSEDEITRFYWRQGGLLALLYALHATDFHFENLIASGQHPVLVDLETLLQPNLHEAREQDAGFRAQQEIMNSVFRTGLLPFRFAVNEEQREGAEISGLGGAAGQKTPYPVLGWEGAATDMMRFIRRRIEIPPQRNRPRLRDAEISTLHYTEEIISGFSSMYKLLEKYRDDLISASGPLEGFAHCTVRCILRPTSAYSSLLTESYHPNLLRDALDRERFFDNLWADAEFNVLLKKVIEQEREDLWAGDIPIFTTFPDSACLYDSRNQVVDGHQHSPSFALMQKRLRELGARDLDRQMWFIRAAMTALSMEESGPLASTAPSSLPQSPASGNDLLQAAIAIGDHLLSSAISGAEGEVTWIGLDMIKEPFWELNVSGPNLYGGLSGIGLFLAYLGKITGEDRFTLLARQTLATVSGGLRNLNDPAKIPIGAFTGLGGMIYFLTHCGVLWRDQELLDKAQDLAISLLEAIPHDESFDVMSGCAGLIAVLLNLNQVRPSSQLLDLAVQCGDHLLKNGRAQGNGLGWITISGSSEPLTGFSHGAAGIAWALMKLAAASGEKRFHRAAVAALSYERSLFSPGHNNWPDLREFVQKADGSPYATAWCHGAAGIGLARVAMLEHYEDAEIHAEIRAALQAINSRRFGSNHCLCHGDLGNFETLLEAERKLQDPGLTDIVRSYPTAILSSIREHGWRCGVPLGVETPGFMMGTAGIGYGLLRLACPEKVPSVLSLSLLQTTRSTHDPALKKE